MAALFSSMMSTKKIRGICNCRAVAPAALVELLRWELIGQLGEEHAADRHAPLPGRAANWALEGQKKPAEAGIDKRSDPIHFSDIKEVVTQPPHRTLVPKGQ